MSAWRRTLSTFRRPSAADMLRRAFHGTAQSASNVASTVIAAAQHIGASGRVYRFEKLLHEKDRLGSVWVAQTDGQRYVLKSLNEEYFDIFTKNLWPHIPQHPNIRLPCDTISNQRTLVYERLTHDFLTLVREERLTPQNRKQVLKSALQGLVELHSKNVVHLDIEPNNVIVDCSFDAGTVTIGKVQLIDLENVLPLDMAGDRALKGRVVGGQCWRSLEGHIAANIGLPMDMFAFGVMCIYAMLGRMVFALDSDYKYQATQGNPGDFVLLQRHVSYFGDEAGIEALKNMVKDNILLCKVLDASWEDRDAHYVPYKHFSTSPGVEAGFKDMILKLTNLDPSKRMTALQTLEHPWFADVEET